MYRDNYYHSLKDEILEMIEKCLTPVALKYRYADTPLESSIKWQPQVLIIGNYSSGKSTLINELLGTQIQATGQAPTDDSFTVLTYDDSLPEGEPIRLMETREGNSLIHDPEYPYAHLKKHGQRFAAHFCLKKVNSPFLKELTLIDTPGMLDSISERERGYDYQEVIGDFAKNAALILVLFDPHKAGTGREAHESLRETLPRQTFEDRILFVLNRVDECASLVDLIRVYGTFCWNLSQMTGRKDIPMIHLTYSPHATHETGKDQAYLKYLDNQREELKKAILVAPRHQLDHMATFVETHSERLAHFLEALISYRKRLQGFRAKFSLIGFLISILSAGTLTVVLMFLGLVPDLILLSMISGGTGVLIFLFWLLVPFTFSSDKFHAKQLENLDDLTLLDTQYRKDTWAAVRQLARDYLAKTKGKYAMGSVKLEHGWVCAVRDEGARDIREALSELSNLPEEEA
ncbi:MAG: Dynamin family protein [Deltaproteobacteria bacterium]|nr:MAG: Dynamin family protein [Deltaproteobacteria bacterium]